MDGLLLLPVFPALEAIIGGPANMGVDWDATRALVVVVASARALLRPTRQHQLVEAMFQDGLDAAVGASADGHGAGTGGFQPVGGIVLAESLETQTGPVVNGAADLTRW
jgi:hypothetical protein